MRYKQNVRNSNAEAKFPQSLHNVASRNKMGENQRILNYWGNENLHALKLALLGLTAILSARDEA